MIEIPRRIFVDLQLLAEECNDIRFGTCPVSPTINKALLQCIEFLDKAGDLGIRRLLSYRLLRITSVL